MIYNFQFERKLRQSTKRLVEMVKVPENIDYKAVKHRPHAKNKNFYKVIAATLCMLILCTITVSAFSENFLFIPGLGSIIKQNNKITHSIEEVTRIQRGDYTHEIISAYIMNNRIYLELFYYKTNVGLSFDQQYQIINKGMINSDADYWVYYKGKKCKDYTKLYGTTINLSFRLPHVNQKDTVVVTLNKGNDVLSELKLYPTTLSEKINSSRPYVSHKNIIVTADVKHINNVMQVYISAILPEDARNTDGVNFVENSVLGFHESDVYAIDNEGKIYHNRSSSTKDDETLLYKNYHFYFFDNVQKNTGIKIIIPGISYYTKNDNIITINGPWVISIE